MDRLVLAPLVPEQLVRAVGEHLVSVHVVRGPRPRLIRVAPISSVRSVTAPSVSNQESPMDAQDLVQRPSERARFAAAKMTKIDCFRSDRLLLGLNCFAPGQDQPAHTHPDADKFYFVVSGKASFSRPVPPVHARPPDFIFATPP